MTELKAFREEKIKEYFRDRLPKHITQGEVQDILFLILNKKPGALVMDADMEAQKVLEELSDEFDLEIKIVEGSERSFLDRLLGRDTRFLKDSVFLAQESERFEILNESDGRFCGFTDRAVGEFLGYPESAVKYYVKKTSEEPAGMKVSEKIDEMIEEGELDKNSKECLEMLSYLPKPEEENIRKAVKKGRDRKKIIEDLGFDIPI